MILWRKTTDVWPVRHTKNFRQHCRFYIIMNCPMTESKKQDQQIEKVMWNVTERVMKERIKELEEDLRAHKDLLKGYKDYIHKVFANDPKQVQMIMLTQQMVEVLLPIDPFKAKTDNAYLHEMLMYRWHLALTIEEFANDYLKKLSDKKFRNEILRDMQGGEEK